MPDAETPSPGGTDSESPDVVADAVTAEVDELYRVGVSRAQAVDSLHTVANELIQHLITPTPGPAQRSALACADALRAAATRLADHVTPPPGGRPPNCSMTITPPRTPPTPQPLPSPHRHRPPEHRRCRPPPRHRRRSTRPVSTCPNTCGHPSLRNTRPHLTAAPDDHS